MYESQRAARVLNRFWDESLPVQPDVLATQLGVGVKPVPAQQLAGASGWYRPPGPDRDSAQILYNIAEPWPRRRFTIAHELGHHVLEHGERPRDAVQAFSLHNYDPIEAAANRFAAELLMPEKAVWHWVVEEGNTSLEQLAALFAVSQVAMRYRLKRLGHLP